MPRPRDNVRDFSGRRWLNLSLRTAHLGGIVLLGAALLGTGAWLTLISGLGMFAGDVWANPGRLKEVAGIAGSFLAGIIGQSVGWYQAGEGAGFIASVVVAILLLWLYGKVRAK